MRQSEIIGKHSVYPSISEDLRAQNDLKRSNMATTSKSPLPPRPQSVPLLRKTMSPDPSNVKASPTRAKTPLVRQFFNSWCDFSLQDFHDSFVVLGRQSVFMPAEQYKLHRFQNALKSSR